MPSFQYVLNRILSHSCRLCCSMYVFFRIETPYRHLKIQISTIMVRNKAKKCSVHWHWNRTNTFWITREFEKIGRCREYIVAQQTNAAMVASKSLYNLSYSRWMASIAHPLCFFLRLNSSSTLLFIGCNVA